MKHILLLVFMSVSFLVHAQEATEKELRYKPKNLDEAYRQLNKIFADSTKQQIMAMPEDDFLAETHFGLGMWIRNNWRLWRGGELAKYFKSIGIFHPDDMSSIILTSYYRKLNGKEIKLDEQVAYYQQYWKNQNDPEYRKQQEERAWEKIKEMYSVGKHVENIVVYHRGHSKNKTTLVEAEITDFQDRKIKVRLLSCADETKWNEVEKELSCEKRECWVNPLDWRLKDE